MGAPLREAYQSGPGIANPCGRNLLGGGLGVSDRGRRGWKILICPAFDAFLEDLTEYLNSSDYTKIHRR
jgi:hypothetical protein